MATVSLLRAVGHVLNKVDGASCPEMRAAVDEVWSEWKADKTANAIFFDFIEDERNSILKEYRPAPARVAPVPPVKPVGHPAEAHGQSAVYVRFCLRKRKKTLASPVVCL